MASLAAAIPAAARIKPVDAAMVSDGREFVDARQRFESGVYEQYHDGRDDDDHYGFLGWHLLFSLDVVFHGVHTDDLVCLAVFGPDSLCVVGTRRNR